MEIKIVQKPPSANIQQQQQGYKFGIKSGKSFLNNNSKIKSRSNIQSSDGKRRHSSWKQQRPQSPSMQSPRSVQNNIQQKKSINSAMKVYNNNSGQNNNNIQNQNNQQNFSQNQLYQQYQPYYNNEKSNQSTNKYFYKQTNNNGGTSQKKPSQQQQIKYQNNTKLKNSKLIQQQQNTNSMQVLRESQLQNRPSSNIVEIHFPIHKVQPQSQKKPTINNNIQQGSNQKRSNNFRIKKQVQQVPQQQQFQQQRNENIHHQQQQQQQFSSKIKTSQQKQGQLQNKKKIRTQTPSVVENRVYNNHHLNIEEFMDTQQQQKQFYRTIDRRFTQQNDHQQHQTDIASPRSQQYTFMDRSALSTHTNNMHHNGYQQQQGVGISMNFSIKSLQQDYQRNSNGQQQQNQSLKHQRRSFIKKQSVYDTKPNSQQVQTGQKQEKFVPIWSPRETPLKKQGSPQKFNSSQKKSGNKQRSENTIMDNLSQASTSQTNLEESQQQIPQNNNPILGLEAQNLKPFSVKARDKSVNQENTNQNSNILIIHFENIFMSNANVSQNFWEKQVTDEIYQQKLRIDTKKCLRQLCRQYTIILVFRNNCKFTKNLFLFLFRNNYSFDAAYYINEIQFMGKHKKFPLALNYDQVFQDFRIQKSIARILILDGFTQDFLVPVTSLTQCEKISKSTLEGQKYHSYFFSKLPQISSLQQKQIKIVYFKKPKNLQNNQQNGQKDYGKQMNPVGGGQYFQDCQNISDIAQSFLQNKKNATFKYGNFQFLQLNLNSIIKFGVHNQFLQRQKDIYFLNIQKSKQQNKGVKGTQDAMCDKRMEEFRDSTIEYIKDKKEDVQNLYFMVGDLMVRNRNLFNSIYKDLNMCKKRRKKNIEDINAEVQIIPPTYKDYFWLENQKNLKLKQDYQECDNNNGSQYEEKIKEMQNKQLHIQEQLLFNCANYDQIQMPDYNNLKCDIGFYLCCENGQNGGGGNNHGNNNLNSNNPNQGNLNSNNNNRKY